MFSYSFVTEKGIAYPPYEENLLKLLKIKLEGRGG
jgi:hypothetical protein